MKPSIQVVHFGSPLVVVHGLGVTEMYQPSGLCIVDHDEQTSICTLSCYSFS